MGAEASEPRHDPSDRRHAAPDAIPGNNPEPAGERAHAPLRRGTGLTMARNNRATITGTYRLNEHEVIQCTVAMPNAYPDAIAEAKTTVLSMLHEELADVMAQNPLPESEAT